MLAALVFEPRCDHPKEDKACTQEFFHFPFNKLGESVV